MENKFYNNYSEGDPEKTITVTIKQLALMNNLHACEKINNTLNELEQWIKEGKSVQSFIAAKRLAWPDFKMLN